MDIVAAMRDKETIITGKNITKSHMLHAYIEPFISQMLQTLQSLLLTLFDCIGTGDALF